MENTELYTVPCDPSIDGASSCKNGIFTTTNTALAAWLVATRRLEFLNAADEENLFKEGETDYEFNDPANIGKNLAHEFYFGVQAVGARSMFNALVMLKREVDALRASEGAE